MTTRATVWEPKRSKKKSSEDVRPLCLVTDFEVRRWPVRPLTHHASGYLCKRCDQSDSSEEPVSPLVHLGPLRNSPVTGQSRHTFA